MPENTDAHPDGGRMANGQGAGDAPDQEAVDAPDPRDLDPISEDEATYQRDADGDLVADVHAVETTEGWRRVEIYPTPKGEALEFERRFRGQDELDVDDLDAILDEKVADPDLDWSDPDLKPGVYLPIVETVMEVMMGEAPSNQFHADVREELAEREASAAGN